MDAAGLGFGSRDSGFRDVRGWGCRAVARTGSRGRATVIRSIPATVATLFRVPEWALVQPLGVRLLFAAVTVQDRPDRLDVGRLRAARIGVAQLQLHPPHRLEHFL